MNSLSRTLGVAVLLANGGCATPPALKLFSGGKTAPTVQKLLNHVSCELANAYRDSQSDTTIARRWRRLVENNFVATVDMTLTVTDTEGVNPSLSVITPLTATGSYFPSPTPAG
jgi:hypothetical protein